MSLKSSLKLQTSSNVQITVQKLEMSNSNQVRVHLYSELTIIFYNLGLHAPRPRRRRGDPPGRLPPLRPIPGEGPPLRGLLPEDVRTLGRTHAQPRAAEPDHGLQDSEGLNSELLPTGVQYIGGENISEKSIFTKGNNIISQNVCLRG